MKQGIMLIPIYNLELNSNTEKIILNNMKKVENVLDIKLIAPKGLDIRQYKEKFSNISIDIFPKWKNTIKSYNRLLLSHGFYEAYKEYEYMLICQLDAWILGSGDELISFMEMNYDYIGAPWGENQKECIEVPRYNIKKWYCMKTIYNICKVRKCNVGNGGLSLRKISACARLLDRKKIEACLWNENEDVFFAYYGINSVLASQYDKHTQYELNIAPFSIAALFAREKEILSNINRVWGVHAWEKENVEMIKVFESIEKTIEE